MWTASIGMSDFLDALKFVFQIDGEGAQLKTHAVTDTSWNGSSCFVVAIVADRALEYRVSISFRANRASPAFGTACYCSRSTWSRVNVTAPCSSNQERRGWDCGAIRCSLVRADRGSVSLRTDSINPRVGWSTDAPSRLWLQSSCWEGSGACVEFSESRAWPLETNRSFLNAPVDGVWQGTAEPGFSLVFQFTEEKQGACLAMRDGNGATRVCGGCAPRTSSGDFVSYCADGDTVNVRVLTVTDALLEVEVSYGQGGSRKVFLTPSEFDPFFLSSWVCSFPGNAYPQWLLAATRTSAGATGLRCAQEIKTETSLSSSREHSLHPQDLAKLAPGLWQAPQYDAFFLRDPVSDELWILHRLEKQRHAVSSCIALSPPASRKIFLQAGAWKPPSPQLSAACSDAGGAAPARVSLSNEARPFFYRPFMCGISERAPRSAGPTSCSCPWRWAQPNETVVVDGAALLKGCALWVNEAAPISSWLLDYKRADCGQDLSSNAETRILKGWRGLPGHCAKSSGISCQLPFSAGRECLPGLETLEGRCFFSVPSETSRAPRAPFSFNAPRAPVTGGGARNPDYCATPEEVRAHEEETASLAPLFLPEVRGQLFAHFTERGLSPDLAWEIGLFVGVPWNDPHRDGSWLMGSGHLYPNMPLFEPHPALALWPATGNGVETQDIFTGLPYPPWAGEEDEIPFFWQVATLRLTIRRSDRPGHNWLVIVSDGLEEDGPGIGDVTAFGLESRFALDARSASWLRTSAGLFFTFVTPLGFMHSFQLRCEIVPDPHDGRRRARLMLSRNSVVDAIEASEQFADRRDPLRRVDIYQNTLVDPMNARQGAWREDASTLVLGNELGVLIPVADSSAAVPDKRLCFVSNLFYLTSDVPRLTPPPYVYAPERDIETSIMVHPERPFDWRFFYGLAVQSSMWRESGTLMVAFSMHHLGPASEFFVDDFMLNREIYFVVEFERGPEDVSPDRQARERSFYQLASATPRWADMGIASVSPPSVSERQSDSWMRPIGWRFIYGPRGGSNGVLLQDVPGKGVFLWSVPAAVHAWRSNNYFREATSFHDPGSVRIATGTDGYWLSTPLPRQSQIYFGAHEPALQCPLAPSVGRFSLTISVLKGDLDSDRVNLAILSHDVSPCDPMVPAELRNPFFQIAVLKTEEGLVSVSHRERLPLPQDAQGLAMSFRTAIAALGRLWRHSPTPLSFHDHEQRLRETGVLSEDSDLHEALALITALQINSGFLRGGGSRGVLRAENMADAVLERAGFLTTGAWAIPAWRLSKFARTSWTPLETGRLELRIEADRVAAYPKNGFVTLRARRPVLRLRVDSEHRKRSSLAQAFHAPEIVAAAALNAKDSAREDECYLCRAKLGLGRSNCPECAWPGATKTGAPPARRRQVAAASALPGHAVIEFEELGEFTLNLQMRFS